MAQTVAFALIGAFILSLTYIPMMSTIVLKNLKHNPNNFSERMMAYLENIYQKRLIQAIANKRKIIISTVVVFFASIVVMSFLGGEFIPALEEGDFAVIINYLIDVLFGLDIFVNFLSAYETENNKTEIRLKAIAKNYLSGWFFLDLIATFPTQVFI